jgi:hypothetical protein
MPQYIPTQQNNKNKKANISEPKKISPETVNC